MNSLLSVCDLYAGYGGGNVVKGVDIEVGKGSIVALLGRNGVGKTTTLRAITGINKPNSGQVIFDGANVTDFEPYQIYEKGISFVQEDRGIFPSLTVKENLTVPVSEEATRNDVEDLYRMFPKLKELQDSKGMHLSGGEQQMLAIARALRREPKLLILDEPSEGLAPQIVQRVGDVVVQIAESGTTVLIVEQDIEFTLNIATDIYVMESGEIKLENKVEEIRDDPSQLYQYLGVGGGQ